MSYKLVKDKSDSIFNVVEIFTNQILFTSDDHELAHEKYRFYKEGGGFDGNTPPFFFHGKFSFTDRKK